MCRQYANSAIMKAVSSQFDARDRLATREDGG
jgi:hypothetical protein